VAHEDHSRLIVAPRRSAPLEEGDSDMRNWVACDTVCLAVCYVASAATKPAKAGSSGDPLSAIFAPVAFS
jgi:hypothetical protein